LARHDAAARYTKLQALAVAPVQVSAEALASLAVEQIHCRWVAVA
jgi:hypothetical protein